MAHRFSILLLFICMLCVSCEREATMEKASLNYVEEQLDKITPVVLTHDISYLPAEEVQVLKLLVKASQYMDDCFLMQVWDGNMDVFRSLKKSSDMKDKKYLDLFNAMFGPWNRLEEDKPFINTTPKPDGANFYPADMTKEEFNAWIADHPDQKETFENTFTMIRRKGDDLVAIPYSEFFKEQLEPAAKLLQEAAELTSDATLSTYLKSRAEAFLSNDYYQSDMDWMDLSGDIEVVIGPYEVYEDNIFEYKGAFESFVCVVDKEESKRFKELESYMREMEEHLPIPNEYKNFNRGTSSPIKIANEIFTAGDTKAGIQTIAFNLPNDERVREAKGSKKVMLKNVMSAKFEKILMPIVDKVIEAQTKRDINFDAYFYHILMHEVSHGLGPGKITIQGRETTVNKELQDLYSVIEEAKADVLGMYNAQFMIDKKVAPKSMERSLYATNLGGMFRSIRFGIDEAHGGGIAIQLNYYLDKAAFKVDADGNFSVNQRLMKKAIKDLAKELLIIQAHGDYKAAQKLVEKYRVLRPEVEAALEKCKDVPVDIRPVYPIEKEIG